MDQSVAEKAGHVIPFARVSFGDPAYPDGVPSSLDTSPIIVDSAADAICVLAGCEWDAITPSRREEFRRWAILAATCAHPEGLRLVAYSLGRSTELAFADAAPVVRQRLVERIERGLKRAAARVSGVSNMVTHALLVSLLRQDAQAERQRKTDGGW